MLDDVTLELPLLDRLGLPMLLLGRDGSCQGVTREAARMLGWTWDDLMGPAFRKRLSRRDDERLGKAIAAAVSGQADVSTSVRLERSSGAHALLHLRMATDGYRIFAHLQDSSIRHEIEEQRSALFQIAPDPMAIASPDGYVTHVNAAWTRLLGWTSEEMRSRPFLEFVHPEDREETTLESRRVFAGEVRRGFRNRYTTRTGAWVRLEWSVYLGSDGRAYASVRDITEQARLLEATQAQLEAHLQNSPLAVVEFDADFRVLRWAGQAEAMFGWAPDEVLGRHPDEWRFAHPGDLPRIHAQTAKMAEGQTPSVVATNRNFHKDGRTLTCQWFSSLIRGPDGEILSILSLAEDITDRVAFERERAEAADQFRSLFHQSAIAMAHVGLDGSWLRINRTFCDFLGYTEAELKALTFQDITHPEDLDADLTLVAQVIARLIDHYRLDKRYVRKDGQVVSARLTVSMRRDLDDRDLHFISVVEDISEQKRAEEALRQSQAELEARVEDRTRTLASLNRSLQAEVIQRREVEQKLRDNDVRLRSILHNSHDAFVAVDEEGCIVEWNRSAESTFGWRRSEAIGRPMSALIIPERFRAMHAEGMQRYMHTEKSHVLGQRVSLLAINRQGHEFPVELTITEVCLGSQRIFTAFLHDISARRDAELRRSESERQLRAITENAPAMIAYLDTEERYRFVNTAFLEWYDARAVDVIGKTVREFRGEEAYALNSPYLQDVHEGRSVTFERELLGARGQSQYAQVSYIPDISDDGTVLGFHAMIFDTSAQKRLAQVMEEKALTDELTGLPNRSAWKAEIPRGLARAQRAGMGVGIMFLDLDGFKQINDNYGHEAGDEVLRQFSALLRATLRCSDFIARLAGDEFVVLLDNVADVEGSPPAVAEKILASMAAPMKVHGRELQVMASIGIAMQRGPDFDANCLMRRADEAMYVAKRSSELRYEVVRC